MSSVSNVNSIHHKKSNDVYGNKFIASNLIKLYFVYYLIY